jgi:hypothetical protein
MSLTVCVTVQGGATCSFDALSEIERVKRSVEQSFRSIPLVRNVQVIEPTKSLQVLVHVDEEDDAVAESVIQTLIDLQKAWPDTHLDLRMIEARYGRMA